MEIPASAVSAVPLVDTTPRRTISVSVIVSGAFTGESEKVEATK
jgi:hypothetical protein